MNMFMDIATYIQADPFYGLYTILAGAGILHVAVTYLNR